MTDAERLRKAANELLWDGQSEWFLGQHKYMRTVAHLAECFLPKELLSEAHEMNIEFDYPTEERQPIRFMYLHMLANFLESEKEKTE